MIWFVADAIGHHFDQTSTNSAVSIRQNICFLPTCLQGLKFGFERPFSSSAIESDVLNMLGCSIYVVFNTSIQQFV